VILKYNALKVERVSKIFENLNSFETMLKMLKTKQIYLKMYFFGFSLFSLFLDFLKILSKRWVKNWVAIDAHSLQCLRSKTSQCFA
jgi:hypothetical protein